MKDFNAMEMPIRNPKAKNLLKFIDRNYSTLAFCRKWLDEKGQSGHLIALKQLCQEGIVVPYPPLCDCKGSYVAQYEHTLFLKPSGKEVLTFDDDF